MKKTFRNNMLAALSLLCVYNLSFSASPKLSNTQASSQLKIIQIYSSPSQNSKIVQKYPGSYAIMVFDQKQGAWRKVADAKTGQQGWLNTDKYPRFKGVQSAEISRHVWQDKAGHIIGVENGYSSTDSFKAQAKQDKRWDKDMATSLMRVQNDLQTQQKQMEKLFNEQLRHMPDVVSVYAYAPQGDSDKIYV